MCEFVNLLKYEVIVFQENKTDPILRLPPADPSFEVKVELDGIDCESVGILVKQYIPNPDILKMMKKEEEAFFVVDQHTINAVPYEYRNRCVFPDEDARLINSTIVCKHFVAYTL